MLMKSEVTTGASILSFEISYRLMSYRMEIGGGGKTPTGNYWGCFIAGELQLR